MKNSLFVLLLSMSMCRLTLNAVTVYRNIHYLDLDTVNKDDQAHKLDVYTPKEAQNTGKVVVFIHGGSWDSGHKETYRFLGKAFAKNGIVTVIINYRLSPAVQYKEMAEDCARAVAWVYSHIKTYGGNQEHIFLAGHSAGGQLAALLTSDPFYLEKAGMKGKIEGCILNDPFGLNIYQYLHHGYKGDATFRRTFTNDPKVWKEASPMFHIQPTAIKYYMLYGGRTYPAISGDSKEFYDKNKTLGNQVEIHCVKRKKHIPMILLFFRKRNEDLQKVVSFMKKN